AHELAEQIKSLKAVNTIAATAERAETRGPITAVEPVTTRIRRRMPKRPEAEQPFVEEPAASEESVAATEAVAPATTESVAAPEVPHSLEPEPVFPALPQTSYRQFVRRTKRRDARQLSFF
ncbi:MAG: hypothetical protein ACREJM_08025, partial [Candidatus Saccharimonadales bacterium]